MSIYLDLALSVSIELSKLIKMQNFEVMLFFRYEAILLKAAKMTFSLAFVPDGYSVEISLILS